MTKRSYPHVRLIVDEKTDAQQGVGFVEGSYRRHPEFAKQYLPHILQYTFDKGFPKKKRDALILGYAHYAYKNHREVMEKGRTAAMVAWKKVEKKYFQLVDNLFKGRPWPEGYYVGFATIWHSYPRNIATKTFYFPYWHTLPLYANKVIAHEMLHFMFFDYIKAKYGLAERAKIRGEHPEYVWRVSEAFNNVIEGWGPYKDVFKYSPQPHKGTEEIFEKMNKQWKRKQDVDWLLDQWLPHAK
jgi:hypothetical protein